MDSNINNFGSKKREREAYVADSESNVTSTSDDCFGVKVDGYLNQLIAIRNDLGRYQHDNIAASYDLELEKDLKQAKSKYYSELAEFDEKTKADDQRLKQKNDLINELNECIGRIIAGSRSQLEVCKEIGPLIRSISVSLSAIEEAEVSDARECAITFAELANKGIDTYGYADKCYEIRKIDISKYRKTNDIAKDCVKVFKFLKEKGPHDPFEPEITASHNALVELNINFDELRLKREAQDREVAKVDSELVILEEKRKVKEQKEAEVMMKDKANEEAYEEKLVEMIHSNMEKQKKFVEMGKKIESMKEKNKELPKFEEKFAILNATTIEKSATLASLKNKIDETKEKIRSKKENTEVLKKKAQLMETEHNTKAQELQSKVNFMEIELREVQAKAQESQIARDKAQEEYEQNQLRLKKIEEEFKASKEEVRQRKAEKKKNLREKRKIKEQLQRELTLLSFTMGVE